MYTLNSWSKKRFPWFLLLLGSISAVLFAYYTQVYDGILPCYYCVYDRYWLTWIALAAFIAFLNPRIVLLRLIAILTFLVVAIKGLLNGQEHLNYLLHKGEIGISCPMKVYYLLPLDKVLPEVYTPIIPCQDGGPIFFGFNFVQLTDLLFFALSILAILLLVAQPFNNRRHGGLDASRSFFR